jgi:hypothetical protein
VAKGQYLIVEDAELEAIEIESTHTIEIDSFVPRSAIDQRFFDSPYYEIPAEPSPELLNPRRCSSNASGLRGQNSAGSPQIYATFQRDNFQRHF